MTAIYSRVRVGPSKIELFCIRKITLDHLVYSVNATELNSKSKGKTIHKMNEKKIDNIALSENKS